MMRPSRKLAAIYLCVAPVDFRQSINSLSMLVETGLGLDPFAATLYVFINKNRDKIKILYWEKNGFCLWYKRLEKQRFQWPKNTDSATVILNGEEINWLLYGFDLSTNKPHKTLHFSSV